MIIDARGGVFLRRLFVHDVDGDGERFHFPTT